MFSLTTDPFCIVGDGSNTVEFGEMVLPSFSIADAMIAMEPFSSFLLAFIARLDIDSFIDSLQIQYMSFCLKLNEREKASE